MNDLAGTVLGEIVAARRRRLEEERGRVPLARLELEARARTDFRNFARALSGNSLRIIAELKRASPSRGILCGRYRRREIAEGYEAAGAAALSVLTEPEFFLGSLDDLRQVREAVGLPVLRKDFIFDSYQVYESVAAGADALLLIAATLGEKELSALLELCDKLKVSALVEVHTEEELERSLAVGAQIVGINNRDLKTMEVSLETSFRLRKKIPSRCLAVSESGIKTAEDLKKLRDAGYNAVLVGEHLMVADDPKRELAELVAACMEKTESVAPRLS